MNITNPIYSSWEQSRQIGEHSIILPFEPPDLKKISYQDLPENKQYFRRTYLPDNWNKLPLSDKKKFANTEWNKRGREGEQGEGFWFMNGGKLEWMCSSHYFYSNWWNIGRSIISKFPEFIEDDRDIYYPFFTDADRDWHYLVDNIFYGTKSLGLVTIENRRGGKTMRIAAYQYEKVSKTHNAKGGTQSRNDEDSYNVFSKVIYGWRHLPSFFKPFDTGDKNPVNDLIFDEPRKRDTKNPNNDYTLFYDQIDENSEPSSSDTQIIDDESDDKKEIDILYSSINYETANEGAYDGTEQLVNLQDEFGKISRKRNIDLLERIRVVCECCMIGSEKVGIVLATTTVEEMEKSGGDQAKRLWIQSSTLDSDARLNPEVFKAGNALDENGFTMSKLHRYFKRSSYGFFGRDEKGVPFLNRHGYSDEERARAYFERKRKNKVGVILNSEKRKFPLEIDDCWVADGKKALYDTIRLEQQIFYNDTLPRNHQDGEISFPIQGNFKWKNGVRDSEVEWHTCDDGKWLNAWMPLPNDRNKKVINYAGKPCPGNKHIGVFGLDPYDDKFTYDNRKSDAASYGLLKKNPMKPLDSDIPITEYVNRPTDPNIMYEDMIMQCVFYGWQILPERNKQGVIKYFEQRGYMEYIMQQPEETHSEWSKNNSDDDAPGIAMSGEYPRTALRESIESYIYQNVGVIFDEKGNQRMGKVYFNRLLLQLRDIDMEEKWTKFDCMVGFGLSLLGSRQYIPKKADSEAVYVFREYGTGLGMQQPVDEKSPVTGRMNSILKTPEQRRKELEEMVKD